MDTLDELTITVEPYKNSIALFGNTKPWKENIKEMGGKFNPGLIRSGVKTSGWLFFDKTKEKEIRELVETINSGQVEQIKSSSFSRANPPKVSGVRERISKGPSFQYQMITYRVPLPYVGQGVTLTVPDDSEEMLEVIAITANNKGCVDLISLRGNGRDYTGVIVSGIWEILDFAKNHSLVFH